MKAYAQLPLSFCEVLDIATYILTGVHIKARKLILFKWTLLKMLLDMLKMLFKPVSTFMLKMLDMQNHMWYERCTMHEGS